MAKMNLYIPDQMKSEMDAIGTGINWSSVAQAAFDREISLRKWQKEPTMENVIERLRASKSEFAQGERELGIQHGRDWAMLRSDYDRLRRMAKIRFGQTDAPYWRVADQALGIDESNRDDSFWFDHDTGEFPSDEYVQAFVEGATEVWEQVSSKI